MRGPSVKRPSTVLNIGDELRRPPWALLEVRPGANCSHTRGENECFWTTFSRSDPSKPGISPSQKNSPGRNGRSFQRACVFCASPAFRFDPWHFLFLRMWGFAICGNRGVASHKQQASTAKRFPRSFATHALPYPPPEKPHPGEMGDLSNALGFFATVLFKYSIPSTN